MMWYTVRWDTQKNEYVLYPEGETWIGFTTWMTEDEAIEERNRLNAREQHHTVMIDENPADFSHSGLGIGGINNDQSLPVIPSVAAIERVQRLHDTDIVCKRCGASKNFDGAMFTNGGGNICDDCF